MTRFVLASFLCTACLSIAGYQIMHIDDPKNTKEVIETFINCWDYPKDVETFVILHVKEGKIVRSDESHPSLFGASLALESTCEGCHVVAIHNHYWSFDFKPSFSEADLRTVRKMREFYGNNFYDFIVIDRYKNYLAYSEYNSANDNPF